MATRAISQIDAFAASHDPKSEPYQIWLANQATAAARKYKLPPWVVWGVLGVETDFGRNDKTSSAGAQGIGQFLPSTAASYGYPVTNATDRATVLRQVDATARYIADLRKQHGGSLDQALHAYSGGGYGLTDVRDKAKSNLISDFLAPSIKDLNADDAGLFGIGRGAGADTKVSGAANAVLKPAEGFLNLLTDPQTWLRLVEILIGAALLLMGLKSFTGGAVDPVGVVARGATAAAAI
jgi:hypothetical protein